MTGDTNKITTVTSNRVTTPPTLLAKKSVSGSASNFPSERGRRFSFCCERTFEPIFNYLLLFGESYYALPYLGGFLLNGLGGCKDVGESWVP